MAAILVFLFGSLWQFLHVPAARAADSHVPAFVGSETCAGCHQSKPSYGDPHSMSVQWLMRRINPYWAISTTRALTITMYARAFSARTGNFLSKPMGPTAISPTFQVKYTFGVDPLQQYLIEFPDGRVQALSIAWDTRPKDKGGQRWIHLYPNEQIKHDDILHWTKLNQNWNFMCAECHSTGVHKNYDAANDRYATTWAEISVGCEACHGQGSSHVAWARGPARAGGRSARRRMRRKDCWFNLTSVPASRGRKTTEPGCLSATECR